MILICPGIHPPQLTEKFLRGLQLPANADYLVFPTQDYPAYSAADILTFLEQNAFRSMPSVLMIGFSAGVVGAIGAATAWQNKSKVKALIAIDGWGVPLFGDFPIHRLSHDFFTGWSSALLGAGEDSFYADPAVEHLAIWRSPQETHGWWVKTPGCQVRCTAAQFLTQLLQRYAKI